MSQIGFFNKIGVSNQIRQGGGRGKQVSMSQNHVILFERRYCARFQLKILNETQLDTLHDCVLDHEPERTQGE